ncbi:MAG: family 20 glycosylhydrolase [Clostridia bacterium]
MKKYLMLLLCFALLMPFLGAFASAASNENPNKAPTVVPAIREWKGTKGKYTLKKDARIVLQKSNLISEARKKIIKDYFADMIGFNIDFAEGLPKSGDIFLCDAAKNDTIGSEGYTLEISDSVTIQSNTEQGFFYGIITILQSIYADGYVPCGSAVDYPMYPVRSGMVDVARAYVPLEYVEEITKYMAWFKMNEIHLHINDQGANGYAIFRLESDVKGLTATDGFYTKKDYRDYQKRMLNYGISVLTEIDTPAHSACFSGNVPDEYMFDQYHIDINNPDAVQFIKNLFDEYITGDDPVFVSKKVHFGTDEFPAGYNEQMRAYTNSLIEHINSRGYTPRFWGSFGNEGFNGTTPVSNKSEANFWAVSLSDYKVLFEMGYDIINTCGPVLYVVPGGNYGFVNYYNLSSMYKNWFINYMGTDASTAVAYDNPQLKGASFALWNDRYTEWGGFSIFDIFDRLRGQICFISEKTWCGEQTRTMSADDFVARFNALSKRAGNTNPGRTVDFPVTTDNFSQYKSVGFPYLASIDVLVNEYAPNSSIFYGGDGELYVSSNGKIGFNRDVYNFTFYYRIQKGKWVNIKLYADTRETVLRQTIQKILSCFKAPLLFCRSKKSVKI